MKRISLILLVLLFAIFACINPPNEQEVTEVPEDEMATSVAATLITMAGGGETPAAPTTAPETGGPQQRCQRQACRLHRCLQLLLFRSRCGLLMSITIICSYGQKVLVR